MIDDVPDWTEFNPQALPDIPDGEDEGRVVALVSTSAAEPWAGDLAVRMARAWSRAGRRVVLADGGVIEPRLGDALGVEGGEGVTDAILFGASVRRVAVPIAEGAFFFIPAGTVTAQPDGLLDQTRWLQLCRGFRDARVTLLVFLPSEQLQALGGLGAATDLVILAAEDEEVASVPGDGAPPLRGVVGLSGEAAEAAQAPGAGGGEPTAESDAAVEETMEEPAFDEESGDEPHEKPDEDSVAQEAGEDLDLGVGALELEGEEEATAADEPDETGDDFALDGDETQDFALEEEGSGFASDEGDDDFAFDEDEEGLFSTEEPDMASDADLLEHGEVEAGEDAASGEELPEAPAGVGPVAEEEPVPEGDAETVSADDVEPGAAEEVEAVAAEDMETGPAHDDEPAHPDDMESAGDEPEGEAPPESEQEPEPDEEDLPQPAMEHFEVAPEKRPSKRPKVLLLVLLLVILAAIGAAWLGYIEIPFITPSGTQASVAPAPPAAPAGAREAVSPLLAYSVAVASYVDPAAADERAGTLATLFPDAVVTVVPVDIDGTVFHRVMAGPARDSAQARTLADRLAEIGGMDPSTLVIRETPRAFRLAEIPDVEAARARAEMLRDMGVPAYALAVEYSDGSTRFRLYAGAFSDAPEASVLQADLEGRGLGDATLSPRIGQLPE